MIASDLIKILERRPNAEILIIAGKDKRTFVVEDTTHAMAHTTFLIADKTPAEYDMLNKHAANRRFHSVKLENNDDKN